MKIDKLSVKKVREFFSVNGLDTLEFESIEVAEEFEGENFCTHEEAYRALGYFRSLYPSLIDFCNLK